MQTRHPECFPVPEHGECEGSGVAGADMATDNFSNSFSAIHESRSQNLDGQPQSHEERAWIRNDSDEV